MIRFLSLITATLFFLQAMAGSLGNINGTYWHDGYAFFKVKESKGVLHFSGGTLHEGGYEFNVVKGRGGKMVIASSYENFDIIPLTGKSASGSTIERKTVAGNDVLVVTSPKGKVTDVLLRLDKDSSFEDVQIDQLNKQLDGVYHNAQGKYLAFNGNNAMSTTPSQNKWDNFKFLSSFDIPTNIIEVLKTGKHYSFDFDKQNIKLDEVKPVDGASWDDEPAVESITSVKYAKVEGVRYTGNSLWPITAQEILPAGYLSCYNIETLRLMRNDIYARHGYKFKDSSLSKIFAAQEWYTPVTSNASALKLNEIERINIALIQNMEKVMKENE